MIKRKLATFMLTLILVMTAALTIQVISYAQEESAGSSTNLQEGVTEYKYSAESDSQKGVALKVEWNGRNSPIFSKKKSHRFLTSPQTTFFRALSINR